MREKTERSEAITAGTARLVGTDAATIFEAACELLDDHAAYARKSNIKNPFGDGTAAKRIADLLT